MSSGGRSWLQVPGKRRLCLVACVLVLAGAAAAAQTPQPPTPALPQAPSALNTVSGTVVDADGALVDGAKVLLVSDATHAVLETETDDLGAFRFAAVPPGTFTLTTTAEDLAPVVTRGRMTVGAVVELSPIALRTATANIEVSALSQHDLAEIDVKQQETQRLLGVLPNYGISYNWQAPPLDAKQKFELATREVISPWTFGVNLGIVGLERGLGGYEEFGPGAEGYWKLYGATMASIAVGNELGGAVFPSLLHQDPRYFWKGTGTVKSRIWYAITRTVICRGDNGKNQVSYSGILGDLSTGALSNLWYPAVDRNGVGVTFRNGLYDIVGDAIGNLEQEFVFKWFTPGSRKRKANGVGGTP